MIVIDASVLADFLLRTADAASLRLRVFQSGKTLHAPHLIDLEVTQVFRRHVVHRQVEPERGWASLRDLAALRLLRYPHYPLLPRIWELRNNFTAYDAAYLALAESLGATLVTRDGRLAKAATQHVDVDLV